VPRKRKQKITTNSVSSLQGLLQEVYDDACTQINHNQKTINELTNTAEPEDVDDLTKIAKEKTNAHKMKDSAIKIKLEVAKVQNDIIKHNGNTKAVVNEMSDGKVGENDFDAIRKMIEEGGNNKDVD
tara:strand:- start:44803 stop:45183 length:381 start_codon:yes stop_codon:yes gene_type:complete